uniref:GLOBIN domain-containing protein n=1 Tax=Panagrellus redivivus TaxID=6233 RepID=A0A7E4UR61_PANRE
MHSLKDQPTHFHSGSWHTASCKFPSSRYVAPAEVDSYTPSPRQVPTICVTSDRRTSISSVLRFTRTFSTDSIDSLEKQCLKEVRRQRVLMEEEAQTSALGLLTAHSTPSYPSLSHVGRSKTDPETPPEGSSKHPPMLGRPMHGQSFDYSKISAVDAGLKRSNPELAVDILKSRTLKDVIGISAYQAKLLLQCWPNIYATGTSGMFASQLYGNLTRRNPKAKVIMQKADGVAVFSQSGTDCTAMHNKLTLDLIDNIIRNLDNSPANIVGYLTEIGQGHKTLKDEGMSIALWDDFGDAILDGVRKNDLVRRHKELRRAWLAIIAFITDNIKSGHSTFRASTSSNDLNNVDKTAPTNGTSRNGCPMSNPDGKKTP